MAKLPPEGKFDRGFGAAHRQGRNGEARRGDGLRR